MSAMSEPAEITNLRDWLKVHDKTHEELGRLVGCTKVHIGRIVDGSPRVSIGLALRIFDATGVKVGPLAEANNSDIPVLRRIHSNSAAA